MVEILHTMRRLRPYVPDTVFCARRVAEVPDGGWRAAAGDGSGREPPSLEIPAPMQPPRGLQGTDVYASCSSSPASRSASSSPALPHPEPTGTLRVEVQSPRARPDSPEGHRPRLLAKDPERLCAERTAVADRDLALGTGLQHRQITILVANLGGVHATIADRGAGVEAPLNACLAAMVGVIKGHRGTVVSFCGGILVAAFNTVSRNSAHALYACQSAVEIQSSVRRLPQPLPVRIGLHTCDALVGNVGTAYIATFHLLTPGLALCGLLSRLNRQLGTHTLASHRCAQAVKDHFDFRGVDRLRFADCPGLSEEDVVEVHELLQEADARGEWIYDLAVRQSSVAAFDVGWGRMKSGEYAAASRLFQQHLADRAGDACARRLQQLADSLSRRSDPVLYERRVGAPWECLEGPAPSVTCQPPSVNCQPLLVGCQPPSVNCQPPSFDCDPPSANHHPTFIDRQSPASPRSIRGGLWQNRRSGS